MRVRIRDNLEATLSVKSRSTTLRRLELEYPVPVIEAEAMIGLRHGAVIEKVRHLVPHGDLTFEVDVFAGEAWWEPYRGLLTAISYQRDEIAFQSGDRVETLPNGTSKPPVRFAVTVRIVRNVPLPKDRIWQRWTFNAPLIQVVEYPGAQREGVTR